ncbi:MAG: DegQ family serine endoprotease [Chitinispirillaceae bacterium]|nr:DegQ family serine endoprotease [Chitinispirillaceae bacterium]
MKKLCLKKSVVSVSVVFSTLIVIILISNCSFAEPKRPERGSINFGAEKPPVIKSVPAIEDFKTIIADIAEKVVPTVVQVIPTKIDTIVFYNNPFYQFFGFPFDDFDEFFFGVPRQRERKEQPKFEKKEQRRQQGLGSGVIVSKDGYILTNYHVVSGADEIEVKTSDGRSFEAEIIGMDSLADVAVIKIKEKVNDLPVAYLGDSDKLRPGDWAIAIGNPFSLTSSVTLGIISALGRSAVTDGNSYQNFIQTDAAINPGNSGGALVNINGELIGINTMIYSRTGGYMGIGFAIPINMARRIMEDLIYEGKVSRGWLGVMIQDLDPATREALKLDPKIKGVLIGDVFKDQPAEKAGIKRGDIVISVDGKVVSNTNELRNEIASIKPGKKVPIKILRDGKEQTVYVTLTSRDKAKVDKSQPENKEEKVKDAEAVAEKIGIKVASITSELKEKYNLPSNAKGVVIVEVLPGSIAQMEGLREGDIIVEINRKPLESISDFKNALKGIKNGESVLFLIEREGNTFFKAFKVKK